MESNPIYKSFPSEFLSLSLCDGFRDFAQSEVFGLEHFKPVASGILR